MANHHQQSGGKAVAGLAALGAGPQIDPHRGQQHDRDCEASRLHPQRIVGTDQADQRAAQGRPDQQSHRPHERECRLALDEVAVADQSRDGAKGGRIHEHAPGRHTKPGGVDHDQR